ncbi:J domain-containing protein [Pseudoscourfieldia marina]
MATPPSGHGPSSGSVLDDAFRTLHLCPHSSYSHKHIHDAYLYMVKQTHPDAVLVHKSASASSSSSASASSASSASSAGSSAGLKSACDSGLLATEARLAEEKFRRVADAYETIKAHGKLRRSGGERYGSAQGAQASTYSTAHASVRRKHPRVATNRAGAPSAAGVAVAMTIPVAVIAVGMMSSGREEVRRPVAFVGGRPDGLLNPPTNPFLDDRDRPRMKVESALTRWPREWWRRNFSTKDGNSDL